MSANDQEQIIQHIRGIFQAFVDKDRDTIRAMHSDDWVGFMGPSVSIERGIDAYMVNADKSLDSFDGLGFELLDTEVQVYGEVAIVYYVARYDYEDADGAAHAIPLRSVDIYRRNGDDWIQCGSHIAVIPEGGKWGEGE